MKTLNAYFKIIRFTNLVLVFFSVFLMNWSITGHFYQYNSILLALGICLIAAGGYVINDYYDVKIDVVNKPNLVLIDRFISRKQAIIFHLTLNIAALLLSLFLSHKIQLIFCCSAVLLWWYSNTLKRLPFWGNLSIAILSSLSILCVFLINHIQNKTLLFFGLLIFISTLAREIVKDIEDKEGDQSHGCRTIPIVFGLRKSKNLIRLLLIVFSGVVLLFPFLFFPTLIIYYYGIIFPLIIHIYLKLYKADKPKDFREISNQLKWIIGLGIISILFL